MKAQTVTPASWLDVPDLRGAPDSQVTAALHEMVDAWDYPCVGAKSVFRRHSATISVLGVMGEPQTSSELSAGLQAFHRDGAAITGLRSFVAAFRGPAFASEVDFEQAVWAQLSQLRELDDQPWDPAVSSDPANPHYCFSVAGKATFVIGMHPLASRMARRAPLPVLVFNPHAQFEELRAAGRYDRIRDVVRRRDTQLQGCPNPMVTDHGQASEAGQYSGRLVEQGWRPPAP